MSPAAADSCPPGQDSCSRENTNTTAEDNTEDGEDGGSTIINIELDRVVDKLQEVLDFFGRMNELMYETMVSVMFDPFRNLLQDLVDFIGSIIVFYPQVYPNEDVETVHQVSMGIAALFTVVVFAAAAVMHMVQDWLSFNPTPTLWKTVPRVFVALGLSTVSLPFIQHLINGSVAVSHLFLPNDVASYAVMATTSGLLLMAVLNAVLLFLVSLLYVLKGLFVMYVAALSPLILLAWSTPWTRKYAAVFLKGFTSALLVAPLGAAAFRLTLALLEMGPKTQIKDWLLASTSFLLLLVIPVIVWSASGQMVRQAGKFSSGARRVVTREMRDSTRKRTDETPELGDWPDADEGGRYG
ncbi:MAG: hypothetical protein SV186_04085 [Candidatus Nanohaloarchaea archaeon]|nr:hypothetical protein [Candidatus Nanohaloarchaea archaeon]